MYRCHFSLRWILSFALLLLSADSRAADQKVGFRNALSSITTPELKRHVEVLADDTFEGREAGSRGGRAAGSYLIRWLQKYGLSGGGDSGGFTQSFGAGYRNILAVMEGADPKLRQEYIIVGAHYDHVGYGNATNSYGPYGYIHNGADDNASGVSGLLELIEAITKLPKRPSRSILFAFWDGEEMGLLGSKHWVSRPTVPLRQVTFMLNCDMIGRLRNDRLEVFGARTGQGLRKLLSEQNQRSNLKLDFQWELEDNSDHAPFFERGVPVIMLHTGLHDDYHRPRDDAHLINHPGMLRVVQLMFGIVHQTANQPNRIAFRPRSRNESSFTKVNLESVRRARPPRLGISWQRNAAGDAVITRVTANTPAHFAGLIAGDRLLSFNGKPLGADEEFVRRIWTLQGKIPAQLSRAGLTEPKDITIELPINPVRVGVTWREDDAEPTTVILTEVVAGSPAQQAGLRPRDRVYRLNNQSFQNGAELKQLLNTLTGSVEVVVERQGRLQTLPMNLPASG